MRNLLKLLVLLFLLSGTVNAKENAVTKADMKAVIKALQPLHEKISKPGPSDWLAQHNEKGQTFAQYVNSRPVTVKGRRKIIYIQPIGKFSDSQDEIVRLTADYMSIYFSVEVKIKQSIALSAIPASARRKHPSWGDDQILTTYVLHNLLKPKLPDDALAMIAFTATDLWPGKGWNFVFGQASIRQRVGVWSIYRNGDPDESKDEYKTCLMRTIKTAVHETGHMLTMYHCTLYECCMCGSNHREESDRRPLYLCPECLAKVCWATQKDPVERYKKLIDFCFQNGFQEEQKFFEESIKKLNSLP